MCAFCTMLTGERHWTEAGTNAGHQSAPPSGRARLMSRTARIQLINRIADQYGCKVSDWANSSFIVRSASGRSVIVDSLPKIWMTVETLSSKVADPLDPGFLEKLTPENH